MNSFLTENKMNGTRRPENLQATSLQDSNIQVMQLESISLYATLVSRWTFGQNQPKLCKRQMNTEYALPLQSASERVDS